MKEAFERDGFVLARSLFSAAEAQVLREHYMALNATGTDPFSEGAPDPVAVDPLKRFPRMMQPHRGEETAMAFATDDRIRIRLTEILGAEPYLVQTMVYFKPAGARGQALHQDQRYLCVEPGTCVAAWMALDRCDPENGCLQVVPGSHRLPVLCPVKSDTSVSFTSETVPLPPGGEAVDVLMEPGDVLFFHGNLIHGSGPNLSSDRFRRIIVGHYILADSSSVSRWYSPIYRFDRSEVVGIGLSEKGSTCGTFVDGKIEMNDTVEAALARH